MRVKQNYHLLTFHTTTAAMAMEDYCHEHGIPGRMIPLPQEISAGCGLGVGACARRSMRRKKIELKNQG